jgi:hypothetical protein
MPSSTQRTLLSKEPFLSKLERVFSHQSQPTSIRQIKPFPTSQTIKNVVKRNFKTLSPTWHNNISGESCGHHVNCNGKKIGLDFIISL